MARVLVNRADVSISGEDFTFRVNFLAYGNGVPGGADTTEVDVQIPATTNSKDAARALIRTAIIAEMARLGYPFTGARISYVGELLAGL